MLYGEFVQTLTGVPEPTVTKGEFSQIVMAIPHKPAHHATLLDALDAYTTPNKVDYDNGTNSVMTQSFGSLPSMLLFQFQRVTFDKTQNMVVKIMDRLLLPEQVSMTR